MNGDDKVTLLELKENVQKMGLIVNEQGAKLEELGKTVQELKKSTERRKKAFKWRVLWDSVKLLIVIAFSVIILYFIISHWPEKVGSKSNPFNEPTKAPVERTAKDEAEAFRIDTCLKITDVHILPDPNFENTLTLNFNIEVLVTEGELYINACESRIEVTRADGTVEYYSGAVKNDIYFNGLKATEESYSKKYPEIKMVNITPEEIKSIKMTGLYVVDRYGNRKYDKTYELVVY